MSRAGHPNNTLEGRGKVGGGGGVAVSGREVGVRPRLVGRARSVPGEADCDLLQRSHQRAWVCSLGVHLAAVF